MLKPLAKKKAIVLPSPQTYLEEWHVHVQQRTNETLQSVLQQHGAAVRIQLRYKKYQEKVRMLLKKSEKAIDEQQQQDQALTSATGSVKAAVRERGVAGSSMALAVAYNVRKDASGTQDTVACDARPPLVLKAAAAATPNSSLYACELRTSLKDASAAKWSAPEWRLPDAQASKQEQLASVARETASGTPSSSALPVSTAGRVASQADLTPVVADAAPTHDDDEDAERSGASDDTLATERTHGFVDIMHHSWLLASMEERCAEAAASVGATSRSGRGSGLRVADFRHTLLDLVFIARSGVGHNYHGRAPSSVAEHHANLLARVQDAVAPGELSPDDARRVSRIFRGLQSDMVLPAVRTLGWLLTKTWRLLFHGVHVDVASLHRVFEALAAAQANGSEDVSVVFAPTHKTHLDYLIISYLCFAYGLPLPRIAAGNNLDLPVLGPFLRANGSFFIRRSFRDDALYKHVLESYVHELLRDGNAIEVFVEGGRSRHGRVCKPRLGFLSMFHNYTKQASKPTRVLLVPIALDYDKVYEVEEYANQLLGKPKVRESIAGFLQSLYDIVFLRCGHAYVRFGTPLGLTAAASLAETAHELAVRMQTTGTITSTSVVAALLMWKRAYQTREMLAARVHWLVDALHAREAHVAPVAVDEIADHALAILNVHVRPNGVLAPQLEYPTRALELGFYRNHVLHVFLPEMAIAGAIDALVREAMSARRGCGAPTVALSLEAIEEKAVMMWNFLEHICRHDAIDLAAHIAAFVRAQAPACGFEDATSAVVVVDCERWRVNKLVGFALSLLWPFVDSLWLCSHGLWSLLSHDDSTAVEHTERDVVRRVQVLARELFLERALAHAEAFCSESIKQSLDFLVERGLIAYAPTRDGRARAIALCGGSPDDSRELVVQALVDEVNGWRRPEARLWTAHVAPANLTRDAAMALMATGEASGTGRGVYDAWMAPSPTASA